jgi:hypothetical protein
MRAALLRKVEMLEAAARGRTRTARATLEALRADRAAVLRLAGLNPEPNQLAFLRSDHTRELLCTTRQFGKSTCVAAKAVTVMLLEPGSLCLCLAPSLRQSTELYMKAVAIYESLGRPVPEARRTATVLELTNKSRLVSLPGKPQTVRGFSRPRLVAIDEGAYVTDELLSAVLPMLARSARGTLVMASSPYGQRGSFYEAWAKGGDAWRRTRVTAGEVPAIPREYLDAERLKLGERYFRQEFLCSFESTCEAVFDAVLIARALEGGIRPPILGGP